MRYHTDIRLKFDRKYVYHVALKKDWEGALKSGSYSMSTRGKTLDEVGFIHLSFRSQLNNILQEIYEDLSPDDLVILKFSAMKLANNLKFEKVNEEEYPHYYGVLGTNQAKKVSPANTARLRFSPSLRTSRGDWRSRRARRA